MQIFCVSLQTEIHKMYQWIHGYMAIDNQCSLYLQVETLALLNLIRLKN
jgi:hypothetical protein